MEYEHETSSGRFYILRSWKKCKSGNLVSVTINALNYNHFSKFTPYNHRENSTKTKSVPAWFVSTKPIPTRPVPRRPVPTRRVPTRTPKPKLKSSNANRIFNNDGIDHVDNSIACADVSCVRLDAVDCEIIVCTSFQLHAFSVDIKPVLGATAAPERGCSRSRTRGQYRMLPTLYDVSLDERLGIVENAFRLVVAHCRKYCVVGRREYREEIAVVAKQRLDAGVHQASVEAEPRFHVQELQEVRAGRWNEDFVDNVNDSVAGSDGPCDTTAFNRYSLWTKAGKQSFVIGSDVGDYTSYWWLC